jgi:hypothetical protein
VLSGSAPGGSGLHSRPSSHRSLQGAIGGFRSCSPLESAGLGTGAARRSRRTSGHLADPAQNALSSSSTGLRPSSGLQRALPHALDDPPPRSLECSGISQHKGRAPKNSHQGRSISSSQRSLSKPSAHNGLRRDHRTIRLAAEPIGPTADRSPMGFLPLRRLQDGAATCAGVTSPGCATPSGFLSLLTSCSALIRTALFHAESVPGVEALRGFPLPVAATALAALCPSGQDLRTPSGPRCHPEGRRARGRTRAEEPSSWDFMHLGGPFATGRC